MSSDDYVGKSGRGQRWATWGRGRRWNVIGHSSRNRHWNESVCLQSLGVKINIALKG